MVEAKNSENYIKDALKEQMELDFRIMEAKRKQEQ